MLFLDDNPFEALPLSLYGVQGARWGIGNANVKGFYSETLEERWGRASANERMVLGCVMIPCK